MGQMPREPEAFAQQVAHLLRRIQPEHSVRIMGPGELVVDGRRLDLDNLRRLVSHDSDRGVEIIEHYLENLFSSDSLCLSTADFEFAGPRIMPRIQPESIFDHLAREQVAHIPWVNGTVIVFVIDLPQLTVSVTTEQMVRWGVDEDDLEHLARENLDGYAPDLEFQTIDSNDGGRAIVVSQQDGYDAARLLLSSLYRKLAPRMGGDFYVATPARDMFVAVSLGPTPFVSRLRERVASDFQRLPYPITDSFYYVTRDGVAGTRLAKAA